jgi:uncharacterized protein YceH (UPF0502 family)
MTRLADIAPRLARARDQWIAIDLDRNRRRLDLIDRRMRLEWLVGHRDLQLVRSCSRRAAVRDQRYMQKRQAKLDAARAGLAQVEADLRALAAER